MLNCWYVWVFAACSMIQQCVGEKHANLRERDGTLALQWEGCGGSSLYDGLRWSWASLAQNWTRHCKGFLEHASHLLKHHHFHTKHFKHQRINLTIIVVGENEFVVSYLCMVMKAITVQSKPIQNWAHGGNPHGKELKKQVRNIICTLWPGTAEVQHF